MKCLLVIDVQKGFVSEKTSHIVPKIIEKMEEFQNELVIATKFINVKNSAYQKFLNWYRLSESPEIDILDDIKTRSNYVIEKQVYTSWCEELKELFLKHDVSEVYLAGIDTDCCVLKTAIDLFENDIRPIVLKDCCASNGGEESHLAAIKVMERTIGRNQLV